MGRFYQPILEWMERDETLEDVFWSKVDKSGDCWIWKGYSNNLGYGYFLVTVDKHELHLKAHRVAYVLVKGEIPKGKTLDHLCRNRACVRPEHLEPVTLSENLHRGWVARGGQKRLN